MFLTAIWSGFVLLMCIVNTHGTVNLLPTIGIIGGGIGGSSTAHFLRELMGPDVSIDVYESASEGGGRLATVDIAGHTYDCGGTIIHPANAYMVNFTQLLGLRKRDRREGSMVIYNGEEVVFQTSDHFVFTLAKMLWRYGLSPLKLERLVSDMLEKFGRIYSAQAEGLAFTTIEALLTAMDTSFVPHLYQTLAAYLEEQGLSSTFVEELANAAIRTNYGQMADNAQSFVGLVSLAGVQPDLWSVHGGNKLVAQKLLDHSKVNLLLKSKVMEVELQGQEQKYKVRSESAGVISEKVYDVLIIAVPLHDDIAEIQFKKFPDHVQFLYPQPYHQTVATFVHGTVNLTTIGLHADDKCPTVTLTCDSDLFFNAIGELLPVNYASKSQVPSVYKVFSQKPLTTEQLDQLFVSHNEVKVIDWLSAYPHYSAEKQKLPSFKLYNHLYYLNAIELAASAMEMSAIGGHNVALLAYHDWYGQSAKVDPPYFMDNPSKSNDEL